MEIRQLQYFVAVAEAGTFVRAAERLHVGQPAVSQQIGRLERELGVRLFERTTRTVRLTAAGERLLPEARAVLAAVDRVREVAADAGTGTELRIGSSHGLGDRLYRVLDELAGAAPGLAVRLTRARQEDRLAAVRAGRLDAAFVRVLKSAPGLELVPVWRDPLVVALPERHPLAERDPLRLNHLGELPVGLAPALNNPPFHAMVTDALRAAGVAPPPGPPFTTLQDTLAEIGTGPPSWTLFYYRDQLPVVPRVAFRKLADLTVLTSLAAPPGVPSPQLRLLLAACARVAEAGRAETSERTG
ncbi:LysR family transcriptional regulator [Pseudonocardia nigra]|uniref:LysR family transcriptional regulator n=1 Tax=Pseudonocardia nigra TaxID=1921578 RepID=UPI001C5EDC3B|nr:LysR family transcriptional regulator [Pseudonocardia nigra]